MENVTPFDPLEDFFKGFFVRPVGLSGPTESTSAIKLDVRENTEQYKVLAELPGIKKEDIHVHIDGPVVAITAERKYEKEASNGERVLRSERHYGKVSRSFQFGQDVDDSNAIAKFVDGVLELTLPKKVAARSKRLNIE